MVSPRPATAPRRLIDSPLATRAGGAPDAVVSGITLDSRAVVPGDLYAALPGEHTHGARFAAQAVTQGAAAIITDATGSALIDAEVPVWVVPDPRSILGQLSAWIYGDPGSALHLIGITGTNGKTTMTYLVEAGLRAAGFRTGIIGTIGVRIGDEAVPSARTTPEAPDTHAILAIMRERGVTAVAMEVSSHALVLGRVDGLVFDVAVFTNLSQDHLDFHGDMAEYFAAKSSLFARDRARQAVVCIDDEWGRRLSGAATVPTETYAVDREADWRLVDVESEPGGSWSGVAEGPHGIRLGVSSPLPGRFNMANVLGSVVAGVRAGADAGRFAGGVSACGGVPGRMEAIRAEGFAAFVDYAHTPDAVARVLRAARGFTQGRVLVGLGCGGDRDRGKRPAMGRVAATAADVVIVTDDNPRSEDPAVIRKAVLAGAATAGSGAVVEEVADRRSAIAELVARARAGDVVMVLGKGHEQGQEVDGVVTPFDDRIVLAEEIARRSSAR